MSKLSLYYPAKPYNVTQAFGIKNDTYMNNGINMTHHNGIDFAVDTDGIVRAMCDCVVTEVGQNDKAGKFVRMMTRQPVEVLGRTAYVGFMYMHADKHLCTLGQVLSAGDEVMVADNTGFSTGPHTHISAYLANESGAKQLVLDPATDHCFDFALFYNGKFSDDIIVSLLLQIKSLYQAIILALLKRRTS